MPCLIEWKWPKILLASRNRHKLQEFRSLFERKLGIAVDGLEVYDNIPEIIEDGRTFEANALKKANTVSDVLNVPVVADDSGLEVEALDGAPGIYSARFAGEYADDAANNDKLLQEMKDIPEERRGARFVCALALSLPDEEPLVVRGVCPGRITHTPRGEFGFGYDPLFELEERAVTMAELTPEEKDRISHRARAMQLLIAQLKQRFHFDNLSHSHCSSRFSP